MFTATREKLLNQARFFSRSGKDEVEYVEAWKYSSVSIFNLKEHEIFQSLAIYLNRVLIIIPYFTSPSMIGYHLLFFMLSASCSLFS